MLRATAVRRKSVPDTVLAKRYEPRRACKTTVMMRKGFCLFASHSNNNSHTRHVAYSTDEDPSIDGVPLGLSTVDDDEEEEDEKDEDVKLPSRRSQNRCKALARSFFQNDDGSSDDEEEFFGEFGVSGYVETSDLDDEPAEYEPPVLPSKKRSNHAVTGGENNHHQKPKKVRRKPPAHPGAGSRAFKGEKYMEPEPNHIDPGLREFQFETPEFKDHYLKEGDLVYCPFGNGEKRSYFWGYIDKKSQSLDKNRHLYDIDFDDGDYLEGEPSDAIYSLTEWKKIKSLSRYFTTEPPMKRSWKYARYHETKSMKNAARAEHVHSEDESVPMDTNEVSSANEPESDSPSDAGNNIGGFAGVEETNSDSEDDSICAQVNKSVEKAVLVSVRISDADDSSEESPIEEEEVQDNIRQRGRHDNNFIGIKSEPFSLFALHEKRCKRCIRCKMKECGKCISCHRNKTSELEQVCWHRMCLKIPLECKQQRIEGLPEDWAIVFDDRNETNMQKVHPDLRGLSFVSPKNEILTIDEATRQLPEDCFSFVYEVLGTRLLDDVKEHPLINQYISTEWLNAAGEVCNVTGTIMKAEKSRIDGAVTCQVRFGDIEHDKPDPLFRSATSIKYNDKPESRSIPEKWAWAWYRRVGESRERSQLYTSVPVQLQIPERLPRLSWVVPKIAHATFDDDTQLPGLNITVGDSFSLQFEVQKSTIHQAGYGVFVRCVSRLPSSSTSTRQSQVLNLPVGYMIDLGVCGPYIVSDVKSELVFAAKDFIHSFQPSCYSVRSFSGQNNESTSCSYFDLTDDSTGLLHSSARHHIAPFINEVSDPKEQTPCVHGEYDVEGAFHLLLGHKHEGDGPYMLAPDDKFHEIFTDYGPDYEGVRLRNGYSRYPGGKAQEAREQLKQFDIEYLDVFDTAQHHEILLVVDFIEGLFDGPSIIGPIVISNTVIVLVALKKRVHFMFETMSTKNTSGHKRAKRCASRLSDLVNKAFDYMGNDNEMKSILEENPSLIRLLSDDTNESDSGSPFAGLSVDLFRAKIVKYGSGTRLARAT